MKKVCFVCNHGVGVSPSIARRFKDYLSTKKIKNIDVVHAGIERTYIKPNTFDFRNYGKQHTKNIRDSDILVLTLDFSKSNRLSDKLNSLKPKGEILDMKGIISKTQGTKENLFDILIKKLYS